jgi:hypothetical protein
LRFHNALHCSAFAVHAENRRTAGGQDGSFTRQWPLVRSQYRPPIINNLRMHSLLRTEKIRKDSARSWDGAGLPPKDALRTRGAPSGASVTKSAAEPRRATTTTIVTATPTATGADDDRDADDDLVSHGGGSEQVRIRLKLFLFKKPGGLAPAGWLL